MEPEFLNNEENSSEFPGIPADDSIVHSSGAFANFVAVGLGGIEGSHMEEPENDWAIVVPVLHKHRATRVDFKKRIRKNPGDRAIEIHMTGSRTWETGFDLGVKKASRAISAAFLSSETEADAQFSSPERIAFYDSLRDYRDVENLEYLGDFLTKLLEIRPILELQDWLTQEFDEWLFQGRVALAAVLEACVQLAVPGTEDALVKVLENKSANPQVASIAAQRIRALNGLNPDLKSTVAADLKHWIELWSKNDATEQYAVLAIPSVLYLLTEESVSWIADLIKVSPPRMAEAATLGVLEWAKRTAYAEITTTEIFNKAIIERFESETHQEPKQHELIATLVWTLGVTTPLNNLLQTVKILVECFQNPAWAEDAAAVRAGRLLYGRFGNTARRLVATEMGGLDSERCYRYEMALMHPAFTR